MSKSILRALFGVFLIASLLLLSSLYSRAENLPKGNVIGFLYAEDGTTPLAGAIVKFKNLTSGMVFESSKSDSYGIFKVQGIEKGLYTYGVVTPEGDFNADNLVGLKVGENETAKLSIAVDPYGKELADAISEVNQELEKNGEALIGMIADFNQSTRMADVQVVKGVLQVNDRTHIKGKATDFYQDVDLLLAGVSETKRVIKGQTGTLKLEQPAQAGDMVYVAPNTNKKLFPLFLIPLGAAAVIGANENVSYGIMKIKDQAIPASPKR
jgi:hypothetical protein